MYSRPPSLRSAWPQEWNGIGRTARHGLRAQPSRQERDFMARLASKARGAFDSAEAYTSPMASDQQRPAARVAERATPPP